MSMSRWNRIYAIVRKIPRGRVATYGLDGHARQTGYALHALPEGSDVPWHRVINARGEISARSGSDSHELQRMLLEAEGIEFDAKGRVDLKVFGVRRRSGRFKETRRK